MEQVTAQDIAAWDADLQALTDRMSWMFNRLEPKVTFGLMLRALPADLSKNNCRRTVKNPHRRPFTAPPVASDLPAGGQIPPR